MGRGLAHSPDHLQWRAMYYSIEPRIWSPEIETRTYQPRYLGRCIVHQPERQRGKKPLSPSHVNSLLAGNKSRRLAGPLR